ncbi:MAG: thiamine phosphate synthase [Phycisphaerae bacterium]
MTSEHPTELRIIDANFNRAREALRVMEEFARFVLDDARLTQACKSLRHALTQSVSEFGQHLIVRREIARDVGRTGSVAGEYERADVGAVVEAACKRASEALRSIEEYGKVGHPTVGRSIERIRYDCYEIERKLLLAARVRSRLARVRLYVLISEAYCRKDWLATARDALRGGADCLQLREKQLSDRELIERAGVLAELCREHDALCIVNDRPDVACASGADGVHLGQDDIPVWAARRVLPARSIVGVSTHGIEQAIAAADQSPDYVALGPMFPSTTKPTAKPAGDRTGASLGPDVLYKVRSEISLPLAAIGGITADNAGEIIATGRTILCVCAAVTQCVDPEAAARRLCELMESGTAAN